MLKEIVLYLNHVCTNYPGDSALGRGYVTEWHFYLSETGQVKTAEAECGFCGWEMASEEFVDEISRALEQLAVEFTLESFRCAPDSEPDPNLS